MSFLLIDIARWILGVVAIACLAAFFIAERFPKSQLAQRIQALLRRAPKTLSALNSRSFLDFDEFALIEYKIPNIHSVIVVSNTIQEPERRLADAVWDNFQQGAKYSFFVSPSSVSEEKLSKYHGWFSHLYHLAKGSAPTEGENSKIHNLPFDSIFSIHTLAGEWPDVPFVFYTFRDEGGDLLTVALKGTTPGVGIASQYERVHPIEAKALLGQCVAGSAAYTRVLEAPIETELPDATVVPLRRQAGTAA